MEDPNGPYCVSFTPKGYLVNQMLDEGWGWDAALVQADRLFSTDGIEPAQSLLGAELQNVKTYIAACDQVPVPAADDYEPHVEEVPAAPEMEVHA